jgi:1,4-dihydroxy-2-naphthoate octaprenyltransferase
VSLFSLLVQVLCNITNDYGDYINNLDQDKEYRLNIIFNNVRHIKYSLLGIYIYSLILFIISSFFLYNILLTCSIYVFIFYLLLDICSIFFALKYSLSMGGVPVSFIPGFSDVLVFLFFGVIPVNAIYYLYSFSYDLDLFILSINMGLFSTSILNLNNIRDLDNDKKNKKNTLAVILGLNKSKIYYSCLIILPFALHMYLLLYCHNIHNVYICQYMYLILLIPVINHLYKLYTDKGICFNYELKKNCFIIFIYSLIVGFFNYILPNFI